MNTNQHSIEDVLPNKDDIIISKKYWDSLKKNYKDNTLISDVLEQIEQYSNLTKEGNKK